MRISDWSSDVCSSDLQGMRGMRPLLLRDIAQELAMHESTVSRATRQKFVQTPWGVFEIKRFFGTALATQEDRKSVVEGKSVSVRVDLGGRRSINKKNKHQEHRSNETKTKERKI